uniref:Uncharacterized protein n=1 Tax=Macaca fascicularis TaxID=9541 RepID=Q9BE75_MACFA|nr:hypothetical protein [Macaca fascicularis]
MKVEKCNLESLPLCTQETLLCVLLCARVAFQWGRLDLLRRSTHLRKIKKQLKLFPLTIKMRICFCCLITMPILMTPVHLREVQLIWAQPAVCLLGDLHVSGSLEHRKHF